MPGRAWAALALFAALLAAGFFAAPSLRKTKVAEAAPGPAAEVKAEAAALPEPPDPSTLITAADQQPATPSCVGDAPDVPEAPPPPPQLSGRLGLWVAEIDPVTAQPLRAVGTRANEQFPLASTYKQAVLWAVAREFEAGRLEPTERFDVTPANQSLGEYPFDGSSARLLTERMIRNSDNTATDTLHRRVGLAAVQRVADDLRLCRTRIILPTKDWWLMEAGMSKTYLERPDWWQRPERLELAQQIDEEAQQTSVHELSPALDHYFEDVHAPEDDLQAHNVSTPYEFSELLAHEYLQPGLGERGGRWLREVAQLGYGRRALRADKVGNVDAFYGKGGNGWRLLTYTGYFHTRDGHHVVYAFMQHGADQLYTMPNTYYAFEWINDAVDSVIGEQKALPLEASLYRATATSAEQFGAGARRSTFR